MNAKRQKAIGQRGVLANAEGRDSKRFGTAAGRLAIRDFAKDARDGASALPLSLLNRLSPAELDLLLAHCVERRVAAGTTLFTQSAPHTATFIVKEGLVRTYYLSPMGKEVTVGFWAVGDLAGGPNFFEDSVHIWSGEAAEDSVVWAIKGRDLQKLSLSVPAIAECVIAALSFKLRWVSLLLQNMGTESVRHRLAHLLLALSEMYGVKGEQGIEIRYPFTQEDLASMICATRQWVSMTFRRFQQEGLVRIAKRRLIILDPDGLHRTVKKLPAE